MSSSIDLLKLIAEKGADSQSAQDIVDNQVAQQLSAQIEYAKRSKKINVRNKLSIEEADAFRDRYGGAFDLNLTQQYHAPHSLAGALRVAEHYDCLDSFPPEDPVIDFGGSWWHHFSRRDKRVHSCCPVLGVRDAARHEERMCRMRKILQESDDFDEVPNFCLNRAQDCDVQADWAICIHGGYDMGFQGLCDAMHSHGVRVLRGTVMFDGAMLFDREGFLPLLKCHWQRDGSGADEVIKFDFENESTLSYIHGWQDLGSFFTESVHCIDGTTYLLEREMLKCNIMTYKIIATNLRCPRETLRHCVWFEDISKYVGVSIPEDWSLNRWKCVRVAKTTVREVEEIAFRCFKENKEWTENMKAVASILSAKSSTVIINGQAIMAGERLDIEDYHLVAFALTLNLYQKYEKLTALRDGMEWKGWCHHFKTRFWWGGDSSRAKVGWLRTLASRFPLLRLDSYADSFKFLTRLSNVEEFEQDSVPISRLRTFWTEEDLFDRLEHEVQTAKTKRSKKKAKVPPAAEIPQEEFHDAPESSSPESVSDDVKPEIDVVPDAEVSVEVPTDPRGISRHGAMKEFVRYCKRLHNNSESNLRHLWDISGGRGSEIANKSIFETYHRIDDMVNVHLANGNWLYPKKYDYTVGYNEHGLGPKHADETYIVDKTCACSNLRDIAEASAKVSVPTCDISMVDGVAGCGKTTAIKDAFRMGEDLIVTANRKSAEDVRMALFPDTFNSKVALDVVRTADSAIMHGVPSCHRLLVDEAGLLHYGQLLVVAALSKCSQVLAFGDTEQISFKSRDAGFKLLHGNLQYDRRDVVHKTYRCPQDVIAAVNLLKRKCGNRDTKYQSWTSESKVSRSLTKRRITSVLQVTIDPNRTYLTMTQADKAALQTRAKDFPVSKDWIDGHIKTVHEAQGISVDNVTLVRLKSTKCDLFKHEEYCLVALTRHKKSFEYCFNGELAGDLIFNCVK
nr:protein associated with replication [Brome mosaic virus]